MSPFITQILLWALFIIVGLIGLAIMIGASWGIMVWVNAGSDEISPTLAPFVLVSMLIVASMPAWNLPLDFITNISPDTSGLSLLLGAVLIIFITQSFMALWFLVSHKRCPQHCQVKDL